MSDEQTIEAEGGSASASALEIKAALDHRDKVVAEEALRGVMAELGNLGLGKERSPDPPVSLEATASVDPHNAPVRVERASYGARPVGDIRYRAIPWNQGGDVRTPEGDHEIKEYLVALRDRDSLAMQRIQNKARADYARQLVIGTPDANSGLAGGSGGPLVPLPLSNLLLTILQRTATMRSISQLFESSATTLRVVLQSGHVTAGWTGENSPISTSNATYADKLLTKHKLTVLTPVSNELLDDAAFNVANLIGSEAGQTMAAEEDDALATSDGTANKPTEGLDVFADTLVASHFVQAKGVGNNELQLSLLYDLYYGVYRPYRSGGVWAGDDEMMKFLSQLVDAQGRPILNMMNAPASTVGESVPGSVGTIFGRPVVEIPSAAGRLYFGDFRRAYMVLDGSPISAMASEHSQFANDVTEFRFIRRVDGRGGQGGTTTRRTFTYTTGVTTVT